MLVDFIAAGFSEDLFWSLTPRQIEAHFAAARKRYRVERNMLMETAYIAAALPHQKNPPKLKDLLIDVDDRPRRKKTPAEMMASLMLALGAPKKNG